MLQHNEGLLSKQERCKHFIIRQLEVSGRDVTEEEVNEMVATGNWEVFNENLLNDERITRSQLSEIEQRHKVQLWLIYLFPRHMSSHVGGLYTDEGSLYVTFIQCVHRFGNHWEMSKLVPWSSLLLSQENINDRFCMVIKTWKCKCEGQSCIWLHIHCSQIHKYSIKLVFKHQTTSSATREIYLCHCTGKKKQNNHICSMDSAGTRSEVQTKVILHLHDKN